MDKFLGTQTTTPLIKNAYSPFTISSSNLVAPEKPITLPPLPQAKPVSPAVVPTFATPTPQSQASATPQGQVVNNQYTDQQGNLRDARTGAVIDRTTGQPTAQFQQPETPQATEQTSGVTDRTSDSLIERISNFFTGQRGRGEIRQELETQAGVPALQKTVDDLSYEIQQMEAQNRADNLALQQQFAGVGATRAGIEPHASALNRNYNIAVLPKIAFYEASLGRLNRAQETIQRAVDTEFEQQALELDRLKTAYEINKDRLEREDKKRAEELARKIKQDERDYEENKFNRTEVLKIATAAVVGAQTLGQSIPTTLLSQIQNAKTPEEAVGLASPYLGAEQALQGQIQRAQLSNIRLDIAKKLGTTQVSKTFTSPLSKASAQTSINSIDALKTAPGINKAVGPTGLGRFTPFKADVMTGDVSDFIGSIEQLVSSLSKDALIRAKEEGAVFGALSDAEWKILGDSATKINAWKIKDKETGEVIGYKAGEKSFKEELDKLSNFAKLDYLIKGGAPEDIGVIETNDGKLWSQNSDGSLSELKRTF